MEYLDYIYEIEDSYINTYGLLKEDKYYMFYLGHYNYYILGEKMIEKLIGRGYITKDECLKKYGIEELEKKSKIKKFIRW